RLAALEASATEALRVQGFDAAASAVSCERFLNMRFSGTDTTLMISGGKSHNSDGGGGGATGCSGSAGGGDADAEILGADFRTGFLEQYRREFGFVLEGRNILVDDVRIRGVGHSGSSAATAGAASADAADTAAVAAPTALAVPAPMEHASCFWEGLGRVATPVYSLDVLRPGDSVTGPAILIQNVSTVVIEPHCTARITATGDIGITVERGGDGGGGTGSGGGGGGGGIGGSADDGGGGGIGTALDPVYLSIFGHRFMGIAEQMGRTLQRTAISVNIKERLDFSCAIFDAAGGLVANAPHLPVHLGAMQEAVRFQVRHWASPGAGGLHEGDVLLSNHPQLAGGSHLPDITVMTPVFHGGAVVFFVASRGHHADVGGIAPGSMPPLSKTLEEEGAAVVAFKLMEGGRFREREISALLAAPAELPGNCGTRNLSDNLSDLRAQVAANNRGVQLMLGLIAEYGLDVVSAYMGHIQANAEQAVRTMLRNFSERRCLPAVGTVRAADHMDDGTPVRLAVTINRVDGSAIFDFAGTGPDMYGNLHAPPAVTASA
ncbi:unnamed protein product, partial [Phaeothamnion confervicola]